MKTEYSYVAVAFLLEGKVLQSIVRTSKTLGTLCGSWYILHETLFPPHVTVWIGYVPTANLKSLLDAVNEVSLNQAFVKVTLGRPNIESGGYVAIPIEKTKDLQQLHLTLLSILNDNRDGYVPDKYLKKLDSYPKEQKDSILNFGTRFAGELYRPHVTIGFVESGTEDVATDILPNDISNQEMKFKSITVFRQAKEGREIEILGIFPLSKK